MFPLKFIIVGGGILGSSLYHLLKEAGHEVKVFDSGKRRVFPTLIHSLLLKGRDVELAKESLDFYRRVGVPMRELPSITLGHVPQDLITLWEGVGVKVEEKHVEWLRARGLYAKGGDRLVSIVHLIHSTPHVKAEVSVDPETFTLRANGREVKGDVIVIAAGAWNPQTVPVSSKSYYCWATLALFGTSEVGSHIIYDYEKGFYSRPLLGFGGNLAIVGDGDVIESPPGRRICVNSADVLSRVRERLGRLAPLYTAGEFCEGTPDMRPAFGNLKENVYYVGGLNGYGAEVGPGIAKLLVDFILKGEENKEYSLSRFNGLRDFRLGREPHEI